MNLSLAMPGHIQSNQRAELLAVLVTCLRDPRPLDIRYDSEYVYKGVHSRSSWSQSGWRGDNADLWDMLSSELESRGSIVNVSWVKGHAKTIDVQRGRTTERDKWGNDGADVLAVKGADLHKIPENILQSARERRSLAKIVQKMMVTVLRARFHAEASQASVVMDRGSEMGDCIEFEPDDPRWTSMSAWRPQSVQMFMTMICFVMTKLSMVSVLLSRTCVFQVAMLCRTMVLLVPMLVLMSFLFLVQTSMMILTVKPCS